MAHGKRRGRRARSRGNGTDSLSQSRRSQNNGGPLSRSLHLEALEDRRMLSLWVVNNFGDLDGPGNVVTGSLRQAVQEANANEGFDQIIFADYLFDGGATGSITLDGRENGGALLLTDIGGVEIIGPGPGLLTISAGGNNRIFLVDDGDEGTLASASISGVTLQFGSPLADDEDGYGGAILNRDFLTLEEVDINNNFAPAGGGGVFTQNGFTEIDRSVIRNNTSLMGGGGIQNGEFEQTDNLPTTTIRNSTITGNTATGIPADDMLTGYGGGVLNFAGTVNIEQSTIYGNFASNDGGGSATQGFDPMVDDDSGMATVYAGLATTNIRSSIIVGNTSADGPSDVGSVGMTEGDESAEPPELPMPFDPQINSEGYNLLGVLTFPSMTSNMDVTLPPGGMGDVANVEPTDVFIDDPFSDPLDPEPWFIDTFTGGPAFGGVLPVFMPDVNKSGGILAIDHGSPLVDGEFDSRGFPFERIYGGNMDIGAAEVQIGNFEVNTLVDESDGRYADVPTSVGFFPINQLNYVPDLSLREALELAELNDRSGLLGVSTVGFSSILTNPDINPDPTLGTPAPTILLTMGEVPVSIPVIIAGPTLFDLEIDATGNDPTPGINNGDGSRVFNISNVVEVSNLILRGGDAQEYGGGVITSGDVTLRNVTLLDNFTTGRGGAIAVQGGDLLIDSTTIQDNVSASSGGGIFISSGDVTVHNSTISGNTGTLHGGGIANADGDLLIRYSTITLNTAASTYGSGVASYRNASASTAIRSSIISGNTINDVQHVLPGANNIVSLGYNLIGDGNAVLDGVFSMPGDQPLETDPMLAPLARLGGPTPVHRLLPGSLALDAGDPNAVGLGDVPIYDQRGFPFDRIEPVRDANGVIIDPGHIDIGSFEVQDDVLLVGNGSAIEGSFATFSAALLESNLTPTDETIVFLPTWAGESFPGDLEVTDSVDIIGIAGFRFFGANILIDDGNNSALLDVSIDNLRFDSNSHIANQENLTIANMQFVDNASTEDGGAISHENGQLTISDSNFIGNSASGPGTAGGAIHVLNGDLEINNTFLSGNSTGVLGGNGGAIYIKDGNFTADNLYITGNSASAATAKGGGIYANNSTLTLNHVVISGNITTGSNSEGGGLAAKDSDITLINPAISFNTTTGSQSSGGAIFVGGGSLDIQNGNLTLNKALGQSSSGGAIASVGADVTITGTNINRNEVRGEFSHGGGIHAVGGDLTIRDSAVVNNTASASGSKGGGIYSDTNLTGTETATIYNSTVSGNTALLQGGGIYSADGLMKIQFSTITDNSVEYFANGGGVASFANSSTTRTEVSSSIISGNFSTEDLGNPNSDVDAVAGNGTNSFVSLGYNVIGVGAPSAPPMVLTAFNQAGDQVGVTDPGLNPLAFNGGQTFNHSLLITSPASNAGDPNAEAGVGNVPTYDQRGTNFSRVVNGRIDVGAYESNFAPIVATAPTDFNDDGQISGLDFLAWQRGFGKTNATKSDGDSNGDMVVDNVDLDNWETTYGTSSLVAAQATSEPEVAPVVAVEESSPVIASSFVAEPIAPASKPLVAAPTAVEEPSPVVASTVIAESSVTRPEIANGFRRNGVIIFGLGHPIRGLSRQVAVAYEDVTAAIDESLAQFARGADPDSPRFDISEDLELVLSQETSEDCDGDFQTEDAVFEMLGEELL